MADAYIIRNLLLSMLAPTRSLIDNYKLFKTKNESRSLLLKWNNGFLVYAIILFCLILLYEGIYGDLPNGIIFIFSLISFSRCNEIGYAFVKDAFDQISETKGAGKFTKSERLRFLAKSYLELIINFAIIHLLISRHFGLASYDCKILNIFDAFYFSVVTITTTGYGDIAPKCIPSRIATIYEIFSGANIIILSLAAYLSLNDQNVKDINQRKFKYYRINQLQKKINTK